MPENGPDLIADARRLAAPAIESIAKDRQAIARRREAISETYAAGDVAVSRDAADWLLRHRFEMHGHDLDWERLTEWAERLPRPPEARFRLGKDERVIARREQAIERKLANVERGHGPLIRVGVELAVLLDDAELSLSRLENL